MKRVLCIALIAILLLFLCSCGGEDMEKSTNDDIKFWTDRETGVQYIIYYESGGYSGYGGITPRLNSDGTLHQNRSG